MKLFQAHTDPERKPAPDPQATAPRPSPNWVRLAMQGGVLLVVFLAGALFAHLGGAATPAALPAPRGLLVITTTMPAHLPTVTPAATPLPAFGEALPTLYINVPATHWAQLAAARERALKRGILLAEDSPEVEGTLRYDNTDRPIQIGLKGDWTDHLRGDKWSLRVKLDDNYFLFGMAVFALQNPPLRQYANEWAYHTHLQRDGVLGLRYRFVQLVLNGQPKGIYSLEEGFSKELFEAQKRREGFILRYNENLLWTWRSLSSNRYVPRGVELFHLIDEYQTNQLVAAPGLGAQRQIAEGRLRAVWTGEARASDVFDAELMGRFLAITQLWGGQHGLIWHNLRYFYNPLSTRLEPIGFNANALDPASAGMDLSPEVFYDDPLLQAAYVRAALQVTSPDYLDKLQADLGSQLAAWNAALSSEFGDLPLPWETLRRRAQEIRQRLEPYQTVYAYLPLGESNVIEVGNILDLPVQAVRIETPGRSLALERAWVVSDSQTMLVEGASVVALKPLAAGARDVTYARLRLPQDVISLTAASPVTVVTRLLGGTDEQRQAAVKRYPEPVAASPQPTATLEQALAQHPFLDSAPGEAWVSVRPGDWTVTTDLALPRGYGLRIGPGTTLRFGANVIVAVYGPVLFEGRPDAPILLTNAPGAETWGGIAIVEAGQPSALSYVTLENTGGLNRPGWATTGALNFYASPARITSSRFQHIRNTDDAINFVHSPFEVLDSLFEDTAADAIDADFSSGRVERCVFVKMGNDALDISGSTLVARQLTATDMGDKAISVGEFSQAEIDGLTATRVYIGAAVKDGSRAALRNARISHAFVAALAAYTKKTEYGPAVLTASAIQLDQVERPTLVQSGNWIDLEGQRVWGGEVDIEKLYLPFTKQK